MDADTDFAIGQLRVSYRAALQGLALACALASSVLCLCRYTPDFGRVSTLLSRTAAAMASKRDVQTPLMGAEDPETTVSIPQADPFIDLRPELVCKAPVCFNRI